MKHRVLLSLLVALSLPLSAQEPPPFTAAIVMEPSTGKVLFEQNGHQPAPTASMTKMMTLLLVLDQIKEGILTWDTPVTVSALASKMGGSQVYLKHGETFPVRDLVAATMVHSANDAAMALAEQVGGTSEAFVKMMNRRAQQMGLKNTRYYSPHGLPGEGEPDDVMSPHDLAILGRELMRDPDIQKLATIQQMPFRDGVFIMYNPNHLLKVYPGATGIKTGFHAKAGFCVTGSARRGNMDLIVVVMGSQRKNDNFQSAANLLTDAFNTYKMVEPVRQGQRLQQQVEIQSGALARVPVAAGAPGRVLIKRGENENVGVEVTPSNAAAPIRQGQQVGWINLKHDGQVVSRVPAVAAISVDPAPWWKKVFQRLWPF
jgi:D-alanyl-D-alanine carboxypeptidase (penicillin-binding protein 5/6)